MNLIMKDFEEHFLAHHPGHVHLEPGATAHSGSSIRRLTSASRHFSLRQPCLPTSVPPVCSYWTMLQFTRTHLPREVAGTFFWQPRAWDPSARRATGLVGACAGCWWVGRREMRRFQLHPGRGAKNAKKGESESKKEQKMMHAQRATLIQVGSCRVTNALPLLLAQALHFLLQEALALPLLGVLGALLPVQLKTPHFASSYPPAAGARSDHTHSSPYRSIPCPGQPEKRASHLSRQVGPGELQHGHIRRGTAITGGWTGLREREAPTGTCYAAPATL